MSCAPHRPRLRYQSGFTLLEILLVVVIISALIFFTLSGVTGVQDSFQLSKSGELFRDYLQHARQLAITRNEPIFVSFAETRDETGYTAINRLVISRLKRDGTREVIERPVRLPVGFSVSSNPTWSSLIVAEQLVPPDTIALASDELIRIWEIRFEPSGSTTLQAEESWYFTLYHHRRSADPEFNFITLVIDPVTARLFSYQP